MWSQMPGDMSFRGHAQCIHLYKILSSHPNDLYPPVSQTMRRIVWSLPDQGLLYRPSMRAYLNEYDMLPDTEPGSVQVYYPGGKDSASLRTQCNSRMPSGWQHRSASMQTDLHSHSSMRPRVFWHLLRLSGWHPSRVRQALRSSIQHMQPSLQSRMPQWRGLW